MTEFGFAAPHWVHLFWGVLGLGAWVYACEGRREKILSRLVSQGMLARLSVGGVGAARGLRTGFLVLGLGLSVLALMRPQWAGRVERVAGLQRDADVFIALDVSKSMWAEDVAPNRLERAKAEIRGLLARLPSLRVGLVGFAGRAAVLCPLTSDHDFFRLSLDDAGPHSVGRGGTRIGDALRRAAASFPVASSAKMVVLITDGEDHDSAPEEAAAALEKLGAPIVAVGFGKEEGATIVRTDPATGAKSELLDRDGRPVISRLDGALLRRLTEKTKGAYIPAGTAAIDLDSIVSAHFEPLLRAPGRTVMRRANFELFPACLLLAAIFLLLAAGWRPRAKVEALAGLLALTVSACASPMDADVAHARAQYAEGRAAMERSEWDAAEKAFLAARDKARGDLRIRHFSAYNLGLVLAEKARAEGVSPEVAADAWKRAGAWFSDAVRLVPEDEDARQNLELVLRKRQQLLDEMSRGKNGLMPRLEAVIDGQRKILGGVREVLSERADGTSALALKDRLVALAVEQRGHNAASGVVMDLAHAELRKLEAEPEDARKAEAKRRIVQLKNLLVYLGTGRDEAFGARRALRRLEAEAAHARGQGALDNFKRAREQLLTPDVVWAHLARDQGALLERTVRAALRAEAATSIAAEHPADGTASSTVAPGWLRPEILAAAENGLLARTYELRARLVAGRNHARTSTVGPPLSDVQLEALEASIEAGAEAIDAMRSAADELTAERVRSAPPVQKEAVEALVRAREALADLRTLVDLAAEHQAALHRAWTELEGVEGREVPAEARAAFRTALAPRRLADNLARVQRLGGLLAEAKAKAEAEGASAGAEGAPSPEAQVPPEVWAEAERLRQAAETALQAKELGARIEGAHPPLKALAQIFYNLVQHLRALRDDASETRDRVAEVAAAPDTWATGGLVPFVRDVGLQAERGAALADAFAARADELTQDPEQAAAADRFQSASESVRTGEQALQVASTLIGEAAEGAAQSTPDLAAVLAAQAEAIAAFDAALAALNPPPPKEDGSDQKQDGQGAGGANDEQGLSERQAAQRLSAARERESQRAKARRRQRGRVDTAPVEKDW